MVTHTNLHTETHISVLIVELHHNVWRAFLCHFGISEYLHLIEDKSLIPGGVKRVPYGHCLLALVQEWYNGIGICQEMSKFSIK